MTQKRNRRAGVEDRWKRADGRPSARAGSGKRWMARFVDEQGRENTKSFDRQKAAQAWLDEITAAQVTGTYVAPKAGRVSVGELHAEVAWYSRAFEGNYGRYAGLYMDISCGTPLGRCGCG